MIAFLEIFLMPNGYSQSHNPFVRSWNQLLKVKIQPNVEGYDKYWEKTITLWNLLGRVQHDTVIPVLVKQASCRM